MGRACGPGDLDKILLQIATELKVAPRQIEAAVELLDGGATVPFIARYRKEATDGLDDIQLRELEARLGYLRELEDRRAAVLKSIAEQGKLTPELHAAVLSAATKQDLEDLYLPYKQKRRTKGMIAREAGLEPLADRLFADPTLDPQAEATALIEAYPGGAKSLADAGFADAFAVLDGVRDLLSERWAEDAALVGKLREWLWTEALLRSKLCDGKDGEQPDNAKFRDYFDYDEPIRNVPSHRALAVFRGRTLEVLDAKLALDEETVPGKPGQAEGRIAIHLGWSHAKRPADELIRKTVAWTWKVKLSLSLERDLFTRLREAAEATAIKVFAENLRDLLLAAPAGKRVVMGLDPGIRTGVKVAVVSDTGKVLATTAVFPHEPKRDWEGSLHALGKLCALHGVNLIAIGNGTASRETDKLAGDLIKRLSAIAPDRKIEKAVVSESGASIYSASEFASKELPDLDVTLRGAVSIARRLQDPLAELVKIDPKSIGVGQYQHDVNQAELARMLARRRRSSSCGNGRMARGGPENPGRPTATISDRSNSRQESRAPWFRHRELSCSPPTPSRPRCCRCSPLFTLRTCQARSPPRFFVARNACPPSGAPDDHDHATRRFETRICPASHRGRGGGFYRCRPGQGGAGWSGGAGRFGSAGRHQLFDRRRHDLGHHHRQGSCRAGTDPSLHRSPAGLCGQGLVSRGAGHDRPGD